MSFLNIDIEEQIKKKDIKQYDLSEFPFLFDLLKQNKLSILKKILKPSQFKYMKSCRKNLSKYYENEEKKSNKLLLNKLKEKGIIKIINNYKNDIEFNDIYENYLLKDFPDLKKENIENMQLFCWYSTIPIYISQLSILLNHFSDDFINYIFLQLKNQDFINTLKLIKSGETERLRKKDYRKAMKSYMSDLYF